MKTSLFTSYALDIKHPCFTSLLGALIIYGNCIYIYITSLRDCVNEIENYTDFPVCLRLWITGNNALNNVEFLAQTDCFAS